MPSANASGMKASLVLDVSKVLSHGFVEKPENGFLTKS